MFITDISMVFLLLALKKEAALCLSMNSTTALLPSCIFNTLTFSPTPDWIVNMVTLWNVAVVGKLEIRTRQPALPPEEEAAPEADLEDMSGPVSGIVLKFPLCVEFAAGVKLRRFGFE